MANNMTSETVETYNISLRTAKKRLKKTQKDLTEIKKYLEDYYIRIDGQGNGLSTEDDLVKLQLQKEQYLHERVDIYEKIIAQKKQQGTGILKRFITRVVVCG